MIIPERLGKYKIKEFLGSGSFGFVYLAEDTLLGKDFALKIQKVKSEKSKELVEEARILFELNHENIIRFYNIEIIEDKIVLVMEPVKGQTLREIIDERAPLNVDEALRIIREVLKALEYAHGKGLVHGDIKPENILIGESTGKIKLADFGLAKIFKKEQGPGIPMGTPFYMAPEAWKGEVSTASDIYSVGCVLAELLSKKPPFYSENLEALRNMVMNGRFDGIPGIQVEINALLKRALSKTPARRPTATQFLSEINKILKSPELDFITIKTVKKDPFFGNLSEEQINFVKDPSPIIILKGVVGSGKTTALAYKVAYFVKKMNFDPSNFLFLTFTGKAVNIFRTILEKILDEDTAKEVTCMTFHQFGQLVLKFEGERIGIPEDFRIVNDGEGESILAGYVGNNVKARRILKEIKIAKGQLLDLSSFSEGASSTWENEVILSAKFYKKYLRENGLLDYEDLILESVNLLKKYPDVAKELRSRFKVVVVDEFQDVNRAIYELILKLTSEDSYLWVSGDESQSIYSFRGASPRYLKHLQEEFPQAKVYFLTHNFRTSKHILDAGLNLLSHSKTSKTLPPLRPLHSKEGLIVFSYHENERKEALFVAEKVKELKSEGYDYADIAIIYRTNEYSKWIEDALKKAEIPYTILEGGSFYDLPEIQAVLALCSFLQSQYDLEKMEILMKFLFDIPSKTTSKLLKEFPKKGKIAFPQDSSDPEIARFKEFWYLLEQRKNELENLQTNETFNPSDVLEELINLLTWYTNLSPTAQENLREFLFLVKEQNFTSFTDILNYVNLMKEVGIMSKRHHGVLLLTAHKAKGLEFPVVFLVGVIEGLFPLGRSVKLEHLDEERRLLFVALTRAQERVYISYPLYFREERAEPSRFIMELTKRRES